MKWLVIAGAVFATSAQADSLCGVTDLAVVQNAISGEWDHKGAAAYVTASTEEMGVIEGATLISEAGDVEIEDLTWVLLPLVKPELSQTVYDVDQMDDVLDTVEAEWIADAVSDTLCGPEELPQLTSVYEVTEDLNGQLTLVPYFSDRMVMVLEAEWRGDWGIAFITLAALLTPVE